MQATSADAVAIDPVAEALLSGRAQMLAEAQEQYLDAHLHEVIALVQSPLSEAEFRQHPLIALLLACGSRGWEDSLG